MHNFDDTADEVIAHFSPHEMQELTILQNGHHKDERTGLPSFAPLMKMLSHSSVTPHISSLREYSPKEEGIGRFIADQGRFGDTHAAVLPRAIADLFDHVLNKGQPSINPKTGKREYFLGSLFSGLSNILSPIKHLVSGAASAIAPVVGQGMTQLSPLISKAAQTFAPVVGNAAQEGISALGTRFGLPPEVTAPLSSLANQGATSLTNMGGDVAQNLVQHLGNNLAGGLNSTAGAAQNMATTAGNYMGQNYGQSPLGNAAAEGLSALGRGLSPAQSMMYGAQGGIDRVSNPIMNYMGNAGLNSFQNYYNGMQPNNAISAGFSSVPSSNARNAALQYGTNAVQNFFNRRAAV